MFFGHLSEIIGLLVLGLLIFGPKRMIEMGGKAGNMLRELQSAMKEMNWSLMGDDADAATLAKTPLGKLSQLAQDLGGQRSVDAEPTPSPQVVETTAQPTSDAPAE